MTVEKGKQITATLPEEISAKTKYLNKNFLIYTPKTYTNDKSKPSPLMIFLHGKGERGNDLKIDHIMSPPRIVHEDKDFPFLLVSPQCLLGEKGTGLWKDGKGWWQTADLQLLLKHVLGTYNCDSRRIYLTGLSMGGFATWEWAKLEPERFAAITPVCGGVDPRDAKTYVKLPIWAFHGAKDHVVPLHFSQLIVKAIRANGGNAKLTVYPDAQHDSWTAAYQTRELYTWLLSKKLPKDKEK